MKLSDLTPYTFKSLRHQMGFDRPSDSRPYWQRRLSTQSQFCQSLVGCGYMTPAQMQLAASHYRLGMSRDGAVIFWQIDEHDSMHDGKLMYYRPDCHRDHHRKPTWVSFLLRRNGFAPDDWRPPHCLFGLHLLAADDGRRVCVVESEKTAVIMSALRPQHIWMATGGKTELSVSRLKPLAGRKVILFPDTDEDGQTYRDWYNIAQAASDQLSQPFTVSSILELRATPAQRKAKIDIADLLFPSA